MSWFWFLLGVTEAPVRGSTVMLSTTDDNDLAVLPWCTLSPRFVLHKEGNRYENGAVLHWQHDSFEFRRPHRRGRFCWP